MDSLADIKQWEALVPSAISQDALWRMRVYRLALYACDLGWQDASELARDTRTQGIADQLYRAIGSISANIAEGYSRNTGRDRARFYSYALGSARESRDWYYKSRFRLGEALCDGRITVLAEIIKLLIAIVTAQPGHMLRESTSPYTDSDPTGD
jgi:four helix bundle protein